MDRFRQTGAVCACPPVSYPTNNSHDMMSPQGYFFPSARYNGHGVHARGHESQMDVPEPKRTNTLENVLLGKVPAAYSHLASQRRPPYSQGRPHTYSSPTAQAQRTYLDIPTPKHLSISPSRLTASHSNTMSQEFSVPMQTPPLAVAHAHSPHPVSPRHMSSPQHWSSHLPSQRHQTPSPLVSSSPMASFSPASPASTCSSSESCQDEPIDLSCKAASPEPPRAESTGSCDGNNSMLRNLLCKGKQHNGQQFGHFKDLSDDSEHLSPIKNVVGTTRVTLAKKNMYPVGSRVSDWLVKIIQFSKSIPEFVNMSHNDKVSLILNSWTRLLLLYMAESNFHFVVTPLQTDVTSSEESTPSPAQPTMKSVESIQSFIRKCQTMNLDQKEYAFLRMAVLFNGGYSGLDRPEHVDQLNSLIQQLLKEHVQTSRPNDVMHYSRLLLCLPALYGINCKMIENLFCKHINGNMDLDMLLKEMLQNL